MCTLIVAKSDVCVCGCVCVCARMLQRERGERVCYVSRMNKHPIFILSNNQT